MIEKIEIIKGPFSSLYGPGAIGGVIHITTNKKQTNKSGKVKILYGTNNTRKVAIYAGNRDENGYINITMSDFYTDGMMPK